MAAPKSAEKFDREFVVDGNRVVLVKGEAVRCDVRYLQLVSDARLEKKFWHSEGEGQLFIMLEEAEKGRKITVGRLISDLPDDDGNAVEKVQVLRVDVEDDYVTAFD